MTDIQLPLNTNLLTSLSEDKQMLITKHLELVLEINKQVNLTRITSYDDALTLHVEDSLSALPEITSAPDGLYGDLGSGGGYPGIPLAIATGRNTVLIDSVKKKTAQLDNIIEQLGLKGQVSTCSERIEELSLSRPTSFSLLTARALSSLSSLLELSVPLLQIGGYLVCYKASVEDMELESAIHLEEVLGMKLVKTREFLLTDETTRRMILVFEKIGIPTIKLPRKKGMAQKRPLS